MIKLKTYKEITAHCFRGKLDFQVQNVEGFGDYYEICHFIEYRRLLLSYAEYEGIPDYVQSLMELGILVTPTCGKIRAMTAVDRASLLK